MNRQQSRQRFYLDVLIPAGGHNDGVLVVGREPDTGHPVLVTILLDGVLALGQSVPQLDGLVTAAGHNLSVVGGESDGHDILGVVFKPAGGLTGAQVPQTQGLVPGAGQGKVTVGGQDNVADKVVVTLQTLLGDSVVVGVITGQLPHQQRLVPKQSFFHK